MANGIQSSFAGNVTRDVQLHHTGSGIAVANVDVAIGHRVKDGDRWKDGEPTYVQLTVWRELAEHAAACLVKGTPVVVTGVLYEEPWERDGRSGVQKKCDVEELGVSLRFGTAQYARSASGQRGGGRSGASGAPGGGQSSQGFGGAQSGGAAWPPAHNDETPF